MSHFSRLLPAWPLGLIFAFAAFGGHARVTNASETAPCHTLSASSLRRPIAWITPSAARDREKLQAWCATVGPVVVEGPLASGTTSRDELVVISWNAHVGGGDIIALVTALQRGDLTGGTPVDHFVLLLQEVFRGGADVPDPIAARFRVPREIVPQRLRGDRRDVREVARSLGLHLVYAPAMRNGARAEDRGNAIAATLPLDELTVIELPFERQRRVALAATITGETSGGDAWRLRVATAHFDTRLALLRGGPAAVRRRQARALIEALAPSTSPLIVGGDFNTWWGDDEPAIRDLRRAFPDARPTARSTWGRIVQAVGAIDHMFARSPRRPLVVGRVPDRFGSDHYPLIASVKLAG